MLIFRLLHVHPSCKTHTVWLVSVAGHRVTFIRTGLWRPPSVLSWVSQSIRSITKLFPGKHIIITLFPSFILPSLSLLCPLYISIFVSFQLWHRAVCQWILPAVHHSSAPQNSSAVVHLLHLSFLRSVICISKADGGYVGWCTHWGSCECMASWPEAQWSSLI